MRTIHYCDYCEFCSPDAKEVEDHEKRHYRWRFLVYFSRGRETTFKWRGMVCPIGVSRKPPDDVRASARVTLTTDGVTGVDRCRMAAWATFSGHEKFPEALEETVKAFRRLHEREPDARDVDGLVKAVERLRTYFTHDAALPEDELRMMKGVVSLS